MGGVKFKTFDLGGHETARRIWKDYFATVDGVIFIVDAADRSRFLEARAELDLLLNSQELSTTPFSVLGNKIDKAEAASEEELRLGLGLQQHVTYGKEVSQLGCAREHMFLQRKDDSNVRPVEVFMCSIVKRIGYNEGMLIKWLQIIA